MAEQSQFQEFTDLAQRLDNISQCADQCAKIIPTLPTEMVPGALNQIRRIEAMQYSVLRFLELEVERLETLQRIALLRMDAGGHA